MAPLVYSNAGCVRGFLRKKRDFCLLGEYKGKYQCCAYFWLTVDLKQTFYP